MEGGIKIRPQKAADGSMIIPDEDLDRYLQKVVFRSASNESMPATGEPDLDVEQLRKSLLGARPNEVIEVEALRSRFVRRIGPLSFVATPLRTAFPYRLVAKIAYESLYFMVGLDLFKEGTLETADMLRRFVLEGRAHPGLHIFRSAASTETYGPIHVVYIQLLPGVLKVEVQFFGHICYVLTAPPIDAAPLEPIARQYDLEGLVGMEHQQNILTRRIGFFALDSGGEQHFLAEA